MSDFVTESFSLAFRQEELITICLDILFYGMFSSLIMFLVYFYWNSKETKRRSSNILLGSILLLHFFRTVNVAINWWQLWRAFIRNGDTSDDILLSLLSPYPSVEYWVSTVPILILTLGLVIVDCIMIWRCWIVCNRAWTSVIMQMVLTLGSFAMGLAYFGTSSSSSFVPFKIANALIITSIASSIASTVLSTLIITIRILQVSRMPGAPQSYRSYTIIEIIVESAAIHATSGLVYLPFILSSGSDDRAIQADYINVFFAYAVVLAPALIMLRVTLGRARPDTVWSNSRVSDIQFNSRPAVERSTGTNCSALVSLRDLNIQSPPGIPVKESSPSRIMFSLNSLP